jgi:arylformamidase
VTSTGAAKVFLDYTQEELDRAYDQRNWADNAEALNATYAAQSAAACAALEVRAGVRYGSGPDETLDVFPARATGAPICVYIHGGGWRLRNADRQAFIAPNLVAHGIAAVVVHFSVIPDVRVPAMIEQARNAVAWVHAHAREFGGDAGRIMICGHSSGGHMAGVLCTTDWAPYGLPADVVKGGCLISGMYDLAPVMLSARADYVTLSKDEIVALSPTRHLDRLTAPLVVAHGTRESPEFMRQARDFAAAVTAAGKQATLVTVNGANHFEMMQHFCDPRDPLGHAALELFTRSG